MSPKLVQEVKQMGTYVPNTSAEQLEMLQACGFRSFEEMYSCIPESLKLQKALDLPEGRTEMETEKVFRELAGKNRVYGTVFRGAGSYRHFIPSIVGEVVGKEEFRTAYTPYQAEISQGVLQSIFEYQTNICELTGFTASNASVYDGATAAAEACEMCREKKHTTILVSASVDPKILSVVRTYSFGRDMKVAVVPEKDGVTDAEALEGMLGDEVSCLLMQQPNYYGLFEDADKLTEIAHKAKTKIIVSCNPIAMAIMKTPAETGVDIAVGEGQPLGLPMGFGGPYIGFMATDAKMMRKLPGRIVGETTDINGNRCFVLTLQAREQHIRREKAASNICSNEALCALTVSVYLAAMGPDGLKAVAESCRAKAHYMKDMLAEAGLAGCHGGAFFHEFVTAAPDEETAQKILSALADEDMLGGLPIGDGRILWCATEMVSKEEIDRLTAVVKEVLAS